MAGAPCWRVMQSRRSPGHPVARSPGHAAHPAYAVRAGRLSIAYDPLSVTAPVVVILAAGDGTRMRSATPKLLHPLCGRPMIEWPVAAAREAGAGMVVVVDGPERRLGEALDGQAQVAVQERPLGTADAVRAAREYIDPAAAIIVLNGDVPLITAETIRALVQAHERDGAAATMATVVLDDPSGYGRVIRAPDGTVERVVETKSPGDASEFELRIREINTGVFAFDGEALLVALAEVRSDNAQGELYLPDVLPILRLHERTVIAHEIGDPTEMLGINDRVALAEVRRIAQRRIQERLMVAGVTIVDPSATVIDVGVEIGQDTVIAPFTSLHGGTTIGARCSVGPHATLIDATVFDGASIVHSYVNAGGSGRARERRTVRLPAPRSGTARRLEGRHVRRDQELGHRRRHEGPPSLLHR